MQEIVEKKDKDCYTWNPSIKELASRVYYTKKVVRYHDKRAATVKGRETIVQNVDISEEIDDNHEFIKFYLTGINAVSGYNKLSSTAQKIMSYVFTKLVHNQDYFYRLDGEIAITTELGSNVIYKGFKELIEKGWIVKSNVKLKYWINVNLYFKGDRLKLLKEFYKTAN
jgi:hypothetical protein